MKKKPAQSKFSPSMMLMLILLGIMSAASPLFAKPSLRISSISGGPVSYDSVNDASFTGTIVIEHRRESVDVDFGFSTGSNASDFTVRYARNNKGNLIAYQIYDNLNDRNIVTDNIPNTVGDWYFEDQYPFSGGWTSYSYPFSVEVPGGQFAPAGSYTDTVTLNLFFSEIGGNTTGSTSRNFSVSISVGTITQMAVGPQGFTAFNPGSGYAVDLQEIELNETAPFDAIVKANVQYTISAESLHGGVLRLSEDPLDPSSIPYTLIFGTGTNPITLSSTPTPVASNRPETGVNGERYNALITITGLPADNTAGEYEDVITLTVAAN